MCNAVMMIVTDLLRYSMTENLADVTSGYNHAEYD